MLGFVLVLSLKLTAFVSPVAKPSCGVEISEG
jgi:hypothetical protein